MNTECGSTVIPNPRKCIFYVLLILAVGPRISKSAEPLPPPKSASDNEIRMMLREHFAEYPKLMVELLSTADAERMAELRRHPNWGVALQSAWTEWVDDRRQVHGPIELSRIREGVRRWIGFVEGRLGVVPPERWCEFVATAKTAVNPPYVNPNPRRMSPLHFKSRTAEANGMVEILNDLYAAPTISGVRKLDILELARNGGTQLQINLAEMPGFLCDYGKLCRGSVVEWTSTKDEQILAFSNLTLPTNMYISVFNATRLTPVWIAEVGGSTQVYPMGGGQSQPFFTEMVIEGSVLYVFGHSEFAAYIEAFDLSNGAPISKFSSALW